MTKCDFCGREGEKENPTTIGIHMNGLTWLWPDEKWICNGCLKRKSVRIAMY